MPNWLGGQSARQNFPSYCRLEELFFQLQQSPGKSQEGKQQSWFCIRYPSRLHNCFFCPPFCYFLGPVCRNLIYSRNESSSPYSADIYFWAGVATQFPGPSQSHSSHCLQPARKVPKQRSESCLKGTNLGFTELFPHSLFMKHPLGQWDGFLQHKRKKWLCFLPSLTKHQCSLDLGALSPTTGSDLTWEITASCCRNRATLMPFLCYGGKKVFRSPAIIY